MPLTDLPTNSVLTIPGWWDNYENASSHKLKRPQWYQAPSGNTSNGYLTLMTEIETDGLIAFAVFHSLCQLLSTLDPDRRYHGQFLDRHHQPLPLARIARMANLEPAHLQLALPILLDIGWITTPDREEIPVPEGQPPRGYKNLRALPSLESPATNSNDLPQRIPTISRDEKPHESEQSADTLPAKGKEGEVRKEGEGGEEPADAEPTPTHQSSSSRPTRPDPPTCAEVLDHLRTHAPHLPAVWRDGQARQSWAFWESKDWRTQTDQDLLGGGRWRPRLIADLEKEFRQHPPRPEDKTAVLPSAKVLTE